jgi:hypothetical protein
VNGTADSEAEMGRKTVTRAKIKPERESFNIEITAQ